MGVHLVDAFEDALLEFVQGGQADVAQEAARDLGEGRLHQVEPRAVLGRVDVLEASRALRSPWWTKTGLMFGSR